MRGPAGRGPGGPEASSQSSLESSPLAKTPAERERTLLACADAARSAKLYDKAETLLRDLARNAEAAATRTQAKKALFQLYEELNKLDELQIKTQEPEKK
jgi:lipopolysaccharide biosynthesis regulator YciM